MFCPKCGTQVIDGAEFCQKCGAKLIGTPSNPVVEPQRAGTSEPTVTADPQRPTDTPKAKNGSPKMAVVGRILMWGSLLLLFFSGLPIFAVGAVIGVILSVVGAKRPWGLSKIIELVVAVIVLVIALVTTLSSGGAGDKYIQMVKDGTLNGYPQMTVGEAFDGFLDNPKWESGLSDDNVRLVNVTGGILYYDKDAELAVQFIVDEKDESFQYNACEINGIPQNNLVFWSLLEAVYNGDSPSKELDSQSNPNSVSDQLVIGETQSYDNEFGNMEVTLDYIQFTDRFENTWPGAYTYPDEGSVFLLAFVTVKNIGTEKGSLLTAWNTLIFDGEYEFEHYTTMGDSLTDINPLTSPTTGTLVFMVPTSVMESDKSLVLNINDGAGKAVISYVIRTGEEPTSGTPSDTSPVDEDGENEDEVLFRGMTLDEVIGMQSADIIENFGESYNWGNDCIQYGVHDTMESILYDDGWVEFDLFGDSGYVSSFSTDPANLTFNGQSLAQDMDTLVTILGDNYINQGGTTYSWSVAWNCGGYEIAFEFSRNIEEINSDIPYSVFVSAVT